MEFSHVPVMPSECIKGLNIKPDGIYVDGTIGGAGHSKLICEQLGPNGTLIGIDRDMDALAVARERLEEMNCKKIFVHSNYSQIKKVLADIGIEKIDGALLDLGVSSFQLDNAERGFSYMHDAPLDMRMDQSAGFTAKDVINGYTEKELANIIKNYGEERWASRIAKFIVEERKNKLFETTSEVVEVIKRAIPAAARREGPHPAKRTFQAIRIAVNDELGELENTVDEYMDVMKKGGRLCIISFHSLEDRIVKMHMGKRMNPCTCPPNIPVCVCGKKADAKKVTGKPIAASDMELESNPRSRSAKLRVVEKI